MIRVRVIAADPTELDQAAAAIGRGLTITDQSPPRPRRSGDGLTLYLRAELPTNDTHRGVPVKKPRLLTVAEARELPRDELLDRLTAESEWFRYRAERGHAGTDHDAYQVHAECMRMIDPARVVGGTHRWLCGDGRDTVTDYMASRPADDN